MRLRIDRALVAHRLRGVCASIAMLFTRRLRIGRASIVRRSHIDCEAFAHRLQGVYDEFCEGLCIDRDAFAQRSRIDSDAFATLLQYLC
jgi:hypothetical protein